MGWRFKNDQDELHVESTKIPSLHAKYYKIYNNLTLLKKVEEIKLKQAKKKNGYITLEKQTQRYT